MEKVSIVGVDISKRVFQLHGSTASGRPVFVKKLSRSGFLPFLEDLPPCLVVMEACGGARHWGRQIIAKGHECRLIPPVYVKPFVKRQKSDANDAAAIVEAAQRPSHAVRGGEAGSGPGRQRCCSGPALFSCGSARRTVNALRGAWNPTRGGMRAERPKGSPELVRPAVWPDALNGRMWTAS